MWREIKVLLLDQNESRSHDLKVILDFIGEETIVCKEADLDGITREHESGSITCAIISQLDNTDKIAEYLVDWDPTLPIILLDASELSDAADEELRKAVIATIETPPNYTKMMDTLHRAQVYKDHMKADPARAQRREAQLFRSLVGLNNV